MSSYTQQVELACGGRGMAAFRSKMSREPDALREGTGIIMYHKIKTMVLSLALIISASALTATAEGPSEGIDRRIVLTEALPNISNHRLTAVTIQLGPGITVPSHQHGGFVFVYVLEGTVRSQLNDNAVTEYEAGESWVEPPGAIHTLTQNPSAKDPAKILAVFVARTDAKLTTSGEISK